MAVPYSAPRGYGAALKLYPYLGIQEYLHLSVPSDNDYSAHMLRVERMNAKQRMREAFDGDLILLGPDIFYIANAMGSDPLTSRMEDTAFARFYQEHNATFRLVYDRDMRAEDFCLLTARELLDPVMRMHVDNGARFIRENGKIAAGFEGSRPEDGAAAGYNIVLSYGYHQLFGHF